MTSLNRTLGGFLLVAVFATASLVQGRTALADDAQAFIKHFADRSLVEVIQPDMADDERSRRIKLLLREHVDIPTVSRFVLGRYWRKADDTARQGFIRALEASLAYNLLTLLKNYSGESLVVDGSEPAGKSGKAIIVKSRMLQPQGEPFAIDWRLKRRDQGYRIIDVATEGVSMALTLRAEYGSFLKRKGDVSALTAALEKRLLTETSVSTAEAPQ